MTVLSAQLSTLCSNSIAVQPEKQSQMDFKNRITCGLQLFSMRVLLAEFVAEVKTDLVQISQQCRCSGAI